MIYPINHLPDKIPIGIQTEQGVEVIGFDLKPWLDALPDMAFTVWHTRPGETDAYPVNDHMMVGTVLYWHPDGYDTAIAGDGKVEIAGVGENRRKLSGFVATSIRVTSLVATKEPGENAAPWYEAVLQAAQDVKVNVDVGTGGLYLVNARNGMSDRTQDEIRAAVADGKTCLLTDDAGRVYTYYEESTDYTQNPPEANCLVFTSRFGVQNTAIFAWQAIVRADGSVRVGSSNNVKTLTIKRGDTTTTYNGSKAVTVEIPDGGTVEVDATLTKANTAADAKVVGDRFTSLSEEIAEKAPAIVDEESAYFHSVVKNRTVSVEGNTFTRDTVKIVSGENHIITLRSYSTKGVTLTAHDGRFLSLSGVANENIASLYVQSAGDGYTNSEDLNGQRIRVVTSTNKAVQANGYDNYKPQLVVRNSASATIKAFESDPADAFRHDVFVDIPSDAGEVTIMFRYLESGVNLDGVEFFAGIYLADGAVMDTGKTVSAGDALAVEIPEGVTEFDSMMHKSVQSVTVDTKTYIDSKTSGNTPTHTDLKYLSPEMFGAVGDGVANDADAVQACIDAAIKDGTPVRGYGSYKCNKGIDIKCDYGDFYLHKVEITAGAYVVKLTGAYNTIRIDNVRSYGVTGAAGFRFETDADTNCESNDVSLGGSTAHSNAIEFVNEYGEVGRFIYYNRVSVQRLLSQQANTIYMWSNGYGCMNENSVWAKYALCNNGYAIYSVGGGKTNRIYGICCEHSTKNVAYGNVSLLDARVTDCLNETAADRGILFKIVDDYPYAILTGDIANWKSVDVSEAMSFEDCKQKAADLIDAGKSHGEAFYRAFSSHKMNFPVICEVDKLWIDGSVEQFNSRHCPPGKIIAYFNHKGFVPSRPWRNSITTSEYRPFETDGRVPTIFEIDANTTIYLEDSYCCIGINEVTIVQKDGHKAKVYGKDYDAKNPEASLIFDGTGLEDGTYKLHCEVAPFSLSVEYSGGVREYSEESCEGLYFGSNDAWTVEKVNALN